MPTLTQRFTMQEASEHNTTEDCWLIIGGKVYDVTAYMDEHPGGDTVMLDVTGKDAMEEFEDAGHSKTARELMETFCIGELDTSSPSIPELEIVSNNQLYNIPKKIVGFSKQYWPVPVAVLGASVVVGFLYLRKK